jgi:hypothetical protein
VYTKLEHLIRIFSEDENCNGHLLSGAKIFKSAAMSSLSLCLMNCQLPPYKSTKPTSFLPSRKALWYENDLIFMGFYLCLHIYVAHHGRRFSEFDA